MTILISARIATIAALAIGTLAACSPDQAADNRQQTRLATLHSTVSLNPPKGHLGRSL